MLNIIVARQGRGKHLVTLYFKYGSEKSGFDSRSRDFTSFVGKILLFFTQNQIKAKQLTGNAADDNSAVCVS